VFGCVQWLRKCHGDKDLSVLCRYWWIRMKDIEAASYDGTAKYGGFQMWRRYLVVSSRSPIKLACEAISLFQPESEPAELLKFDLWIPNLSIRPRRVLG
jgi:hypothetical protein